MKLTIWMGLLRLLGLFFTICVGIVSATIVVSPFVWYANFTANDGPLFPPPLVSLGFFGLPHAILIFPWQLITLAYEILRAKPPSRMTLTILGVASGLTAALLWYQVMRAGSNQPDLLLMLAGAAIIQGLVVFWAHGLTSKATKAILEIIFET